MHKRKVRNNLIRRIGLIVGISLIVVGVVLTMRNQHYLRATSIQITVQMQTYASTPLRWFVHAIGRWVFNAILFLHLALLFYMREKNCALKIFLLVQLTGFFNQIVKLATQDARPSLQNEAVAEQDNCECSFGQPSSNVTLTVLFGLVVCKEFVARITPKLIFRLLWFVIFACVCVSAIISSLFCGSNYLDQIITGASIGLIVFFIAWLFEHPIDLGMQSAIDFVPKHKEHKIITCFAVIIPSFCMFLLSWMLWKRRSSDHPKWSFNTQCDLACRQHGLTLADRDLVSCGLYTPAMLLFSILMFFGKGTTAHNPFYYSESLIGFLRFAKRFLVFTITSLPLFLGLISIHFVKPWVSYLVQILCGTVFAFLFVFCLKPMLQYFAVDISGDYFIDKGFDIFDATGSEVEFVETLSSEISRRSKKSRI